MCREQTSVYDEKRRDQETLSLGNLRSGSRKEEGHVKKCGGEKGGDRNVK